MATVTTSIGQGTGHSETVTINSVSGTGPYTVTLSATVPSTVVLGDALYDEAATPNKYLITGISGSDLTVVDSTGVGAAPDDTSAASTPVIERYYNGSTPQTDWESELDDTNLYASADDAQGECYNDAAFDEAVAVNGGSTVGLNSVTLTAPSSERHDGTATTGVENAKGLSIQQEYVTVEWIELHSGSSPAGSRIVWIDTNDNSSPAVFQNNIVHDYSVGAANNGEGIMSFDGAANIQNNIIYDITHTRVSDSFSIRGILVESGRSNIGKVNNNTVVNVAVVDSGSGGDAIGISVVDGTGEEVQNNISMDSSVAGAGAATDFNPSSYSNATASNNLSSDATAPGTGSLTSKTSANQFVSTTGGAEDLHLTTGSDAENAGTDLNTTPTGVNIDIDGNDREGMVGNWDMGAHQYYEDYDKVVTTIGQGTTHDENVTISATAGSGPYLVTLSASSGAVVGDALYDEAAVPNKYRIIEISGSSLSVVDSEGVGAAPDNSATSTPTVERYYNGSTPITDWESELDNTPLYASGDDAEGRVYNDAVFDESVTINGGGTVGLNSVTLTVPSSERHDGTAGTGSRMVSTSSQIVLGATTPVELSWLEIDKNGESGLGSAFSASSTSTNLAEVHGVIAHGKHRTVGTTSISLAGFGTNRTATITNSILYGIKGTSTFDGSAAVTNIGTGTTGTHIRQAYNNTIYGPDIVGTRTATGLGFTDNSDWTVRNNIAIDAGSTTSGTIQDFSVSSPVNATADHNLSSDATATGTGSLTNKTAANQFVSTTEGAEDLHLKTGADAIDAGTDLGTTPTGVNIDIDGRDRDAEGDTWDIGAHEFVAAAGGGGAFSGTYTANIFRSSIIRSVRKLML